MKGINKLPKTWAFVAHPCGYDPYNSYDLSFILDTEQRELHAFRDDIVADRIRRDEVAEDVAVGPLYNKTPKAFDPDADLFL